MVEVRRSDALIEQIKMTGGSPRRVSVFWNCNISIYQGLDKVATISFSKSAFSSADEESILRKLKLYKGSPMPLPHSEGSLATKLGKYPEIKAWFLKQIRTGAMDERSMFLLKKFSGGNRDE